MIGRQICIGVIALGLCWHRAGGADDAPTTTPAANEVPPATLVTLQIKEQPVRDALAEFTKATGIKIETVHLEWSRHQGQTLTLDMKNRPLWEVLGELCALSGLRVDGAASQSVTLADDMVGWNKRPVQLCGAFRFDLGAVDAEKTVTFARLPIRAQKYSLFGDITAEPNVRIAGCDGLKIDAMLDEAGRPIPIITRFNLTPEFRRQRGGLQVQFSPDAQSHQISRLAGTIRIALSEGEQKVEILQIMEANDRVCVVGPYELHITTTPADNGCDVHILIKGDDRVAVERMRYQAAGDGPVVIDEKGNSYRWTSIGSSPNGAVRVCYRKNLFGEDKANLGPPAKLVWMVPTKARVVTVPFEFKDIPLP